ncbi:cellulose binding domain-containing protein [Streptomyces sp. NPDC086519]|uniref:cellulose binding domain-containing protein n=1 Tax=Streptomyces sp. NPDC086519 TaxID=3154863 RepID=UPI00343736CD
MSGAVAAADVSYNATIAPSASVSIGHQAVHTGDSAAPTAYSLNGTPARSADDGTAAVPSPGRSP